MFEGIVASLLNRYLGKYIEDLDLENLNVGIFGGNVLLSNLKLKTEALVSIAINFKWNKNYYNYYEYFIIINFSTNSDYPLKWKQVQ